MSSESAIERKLKRQIAARKEAERLLEQKSLELFESNQQLELALRQLEKRSNANLRRIEFQEQIDNLLIDFGRAFLRNDLNDVMLSELTTNVTNSYLIEASRLILPPKLLPQLQANDYGDDTVEALDQDIQEPLWNGEVLTVPLEVEKVIVGTLIVRVRLLDQDYEFIQSQLLLVTDLICSALTHQLAINRNIESRQRAEESERATRDFVAMINHELRTPLNGLLGSAELISDTELSSSQREIVNNLSQSGEFLRTIINDLLDYSKINAGMLELIPKKFALRDLRNTIESIFVNRAIEKQLEFNISVASNVPSHFQGDLERITQLFVNLIGNAIKFTDKGHVNVDIEWDNNHFVFSVEDTGVGIAESAHKTLFEPFTQADNSSSRNYEGTGLGLAICRKLVALMNGEIGVSSVVGTGTTFTISVPLQVVDMPTESDQVSKGFQSEVELSLLKVLVVDDIKMNQIIIQQMLRKHKIEPAIASNGVEGLELASDNEYDIVFMDCRMPVMDGFEATEKLREKGYARSIVALTAGTTLEERERCIQCGMDDILSKPYTANDLNEMLKKWGVSSVKGA
ncbi:ATP-binding protein [Vibrio sp. 10N.261.46.E12]|uniref:ATP-binding protein n=1 Tax=unclassified Vibrio TaxID=2614977 RepID=UPI0009784CB9|nr:MULTISPECIES: ATP-binding protein [unclassified Vibrio]OMO36594.1 hybrid sensor histidine kinase/response regulator [Vibrio sp. 10N.261.45.E1]PMJ26416.1 hybrid sensor histidine kinase/response regulator [Vibrio sp. 10N.286.45.B6]PML90224.1 hybrid sensor histidine kinase/response regulator [Vibrio sp. 10N.261.49.E11]PMM67957.1 hybrid sensor histidine kinase/response regulator [Vibrio sp. 10N.261.46.F12]PMM80105.1 hybrid sensor histidine kinase/response regulator [Vibrio sp. 10N.261.46.E8]